MVALQVFTVGITTVYKFSPKHDFPKGLGMRNRLSPEWNYIAT